MDEAREFALELNRHIVRSDDGVLDYWTNLIKARDAAILRRAADQVPCTCTATLCSQPDCGDFHERRNPECPHHKILALAGPEADRALLVHDAAILRRAADKSFCTLCEAGYPPAELMPDGKWWHRDSRGSALLMPGKYRECPKAAILAITALPLDAAGEGAEEKLPCGHPKSSWIKRFHAAGSRPFGKDKCVPDAHDHAYCADCRGAERPVREDK